MFKAQYLEEKPIMKFPLLPLINELIHSIALMIIVSEVRRCIRSYTRLADGFTLGLASLYKIQAHRRIILTFVGEALTAMGFHLVTKHYLMPLAASTPSAACSLPTLYVR